MPEMTFPDKFNATSYFVDANLERGFGDRTAIYYLDRQISYGEVFEKVNRAGNALKNLGVRMEERVLLLLLDCPEFAYTFWGAIKAGCVPIPVNTNLKPKDYLYFLNDSRAAAMVVSAELLAVVEEILPDCQFLRQVLVVGSCDTSHLCFGKLLQEAEKELDPAPTSKDDPAFWLYSSGTTGFPKGTVHLQHDMVFSTEKYAKPILGICQDDITYSVAKLFFAYGLGNGLYFPFAVGAATVFNPKRPSPASILTTAEKRKPTLFFGVPTAYVGMLEYLENNPGYTLGGRVRSCVSAGEALPGVVFQRWRERFGVEILDGIGSTEICHIFISNLSGKVKPGSSGYPVPGYEIKLIDDEGQPVSQGEVGNLMVKGDSIAAYYWNKHEKSKFTFRGEWIFTGDKYYQDEEGCYWYVGRSDDMIKVGGIWVSPIEVENTLAEHPLVSEAAVIGVENNDGLVKSRAYVIPREQPASKKELALQLQQFVKERLAPYKYPREVKFVSELPKTATGKIQRYKLRLEAQQEEK